MKNRIQYMDGYRGLAILLVIAFHAYTRWPELVPYGDQYAYPFFKIGWVGVRLFFLISGFVILMTLERSTHFTQFMYRRWLRLFPAMLICSVLIFVTVGLFNARPSGIPTFSSLVPGLTFTEIELWRTLFGFPQHDLEGTFWSLYVEFKFYIFAALIYFWKGTRVLIASLVALFFLASLTSIITMHFPSTYSATIQQWLYISSFQHFGWFAAGASFYLYTKNKDFHWFLIAVGIALLSSAFVKDLDIKATLVATLMSALFAYSVINERIQSWLSNRLFLFFGFISYPMYLIHENSLISMIIQLDQAKFGIPHFLLPILPIVLLSTVAFIIAKYLERPTKNLIASTVSYMSHTATA